MARTSQRAVANRERIRALKVEQWLVDWNKVSYNSREHRRKPNKYFYIFSLSARQLRALSGIRRRSATDLRRHTQELGIQRSHEESRSKKISEYIKYGHPWSELPLAKRINENKSLRKPGWLPTAIVVNVLTSDDERDGAKVYKKDLIDIVELEGDLIEVRLPVIVGDSRWKPKGIHPVEVIDGQHRLLAFDEGIDPDYQLPVVAFHGLDISWQAYLFWTINIKPKRINPSLAYDLYPLLRTEDWLNRFEGHKVYRESRAQEIVELLWAEPKSPWYHRINMLGEKGGPTVSQAAWIRALLKTYIKTAEGRGISIGGLFGAAGGTHDMMLAWNKSQQAALLIFVWNSIEETIKSSNFEWAVKLRKTEYKSSISGDSATRGPHSLLNNDQGITVILGLTNDLLFMNSSKLNLYSWKIDTGLLVSDALLALEKEQHKLVRYVKALTKTLAKFDWRTSASDSLTDRERTTKLTFRGGSGYREFRRQLLKFLIKSRRFEKDARHLYKATGFEKK